MAMTPAERISFLEGEIRRGLRELSGEQKYIIYDPTGLPTACRDLYDKWLALHEAAENARIKKAP